ncbi:hypothetical protein [Streptomyces similanensis]|uniref:Uncharacterized protein n=1 Tax=Streptomyces similanensis TaxID=1274988 RepID=A0ABP9KHV4_9ACTN
MTKNDRAVSGGTDYAEAASELRRTLAERLRGRPVPPDLVVTTRAEIERREFRAYGQGWRDRGEHEEQRGERARSVRGPADGAKVLPFPQPQPQPQREPSAPAAADRHRADPGLADPCQSDPGRPRTHRAGPEQTEPRTPGPHPTGPHPHPSGAPAARPHPADDLC